MKINQEHEFRLDIDTLDYRKLLDLYRQKDFTKSYNTQFSYLRSDLHRNDKKNSVQVLYTLFTNSLIQVQELIQKFVRLPTSWSYLFVFYVQPELIQNSAWLQKLSYRANLYSSSWAKEFITLNSSSDNWLEMYKLSTWCFLSYLAASIFTRFWLLHYPSSDSTKSSWRMGLSDDFNICRGDNPRSLHSMAVHKCLGRAKNHSCEVGWRIACRMTHSC
jgi:hypothetical protein